MNGTEEKSVMRRQWGGGRTKRRYKLKEWNKYNLHIAELHAAKSRETSVKHASDPVYIPEVSQLPAVVES